MLLQRGCLNYWVSAMMLRSITQNIMHYKTTQLLKNVYKFSLFIEKINLSFNQFLIVNDNESILIETGFRRYFPLLKDSIEEVCSLESIKKVFVPHFEGDEMGALGEFLNVNKNIQVYASPICAFSLSDLFDIKVISLKD